MNPPRDEPSIRPFGEFDLIRWIRERCAPRPGIAIGIGDDCAVLGGAFTPSLLATTDMLMEGRHFRLDEATLEEVGYKCLAVNLSDIAAMAGIPIAALLAVALPRGRAVEVAQRLFAGMAPLAERFHVALVGGDTNAWDGPLVLSVTVLGESVPPGPYTRSGARPGDVVLVTGPLGGSLLGRHLRPTPRIDEALALNGTGCVRALIDISDGLTSDLGHILEESGGLGATLEADAIPIHPDANALSARDGRSPLDHALNDGEDFELCVVVGPEEAGSLLRRPPEGAPLFRVGVIEAEPGLRLRSQDGAVQAITARGFDHLTMGTDGGADG